MPRGKHRKKKPRPWVRVYEKCTRGYKSTCPECGTNDIRVIYNELGYIALVCKNNHHWQESFSEGKIIHLDMEWKEAT